MNMARIKEEIGQKRPFRNPHHEALVNLIYTANWCQDRIKELLKPHGVTPQQYNVLRILRGAGGPISTSVIRERLLDKMSDTSRMVDRLYKKGWVQRQVCLTDKRLVDVELSEQGKELLQGLSDIEAELDRILGGLDPEEAGELSELLNQARD